MFKRCTLLLLVCTLLTGWVCPARAAGSNEETYTLAQRELLRYFNGENSKSLDALCADFATLGRYQKSTLFLYYTALLRDTEAEQFGQIDVYVTLLSIDPDFSALLAGAGLPSVAEVSAYARGRQAEAAHDNAGAAMYYQQCGGVLDSPMRLWYLLLATPTPSPRRTPTATPTRTPTPSPKRTPTPTPKVKKPSVGSTVIFGAYEQDNRTSNGKEEIEWLVLDYDATRSYVLLISRYCLDAHYFNRESYDSWRNCDIRSWLNSDFYNAAFTSSEKNALRLTNVQTATESGRLDTTQDRVFLLSKDEAMKYFPGGEDVEVVARRAVPTAYAVANMAYQSTKTFVNGKGTTCWWLRSYYGSRYAHGVRESGKIFGYSLKTYNTNKWYGVRPVIWVDVSAIH